VPARDVFVGSEINPEMRVAFVSVVMVVPVRTAVEKLGSTVYVPANPNVDVPYAVTIGLISFPGIFMIEPISITPELILTTVRVVPVIPPMN
jgi:hypothetical protein